MINNILLGFQVCPKHTNRGQDRLGAKYYGGSSVSCNQVVDFNDSRVRIWFILYSSEYPLLSSGASNDMRRMVLIKLSEFVAKFNFVSFARFIPRKSERLATRAHFSMKSGEERQDLQFHSHCSPLYPG